MNPLVSVIVPVYNGALFIGAALRSVQVAMSDVAYEIIVVNDGSIDRTEQVLQEWMGVIHYLEQSNQGAALARNTGLQQARGEYVAFLDADDVWAAHHFAVLRDGFTKTPSIQIVLGHVQRFRSSVMTPEQQDLYGSPILLPQFGSGLFKREVFGYIPLVQEVHRLHEDVDWFLRAVEYGVAIRIVPEVVSYYRLHEQNTTRDVRSGDVEMLHVLAASLKRRGAQEISSLREVGL